MRDHDRETKKDGGQGQPPLKAKAGGEQDSARKYTDGHPSAHPGLLQDERAAHPANAEPLAELLSQLQHSHGNAYVQRVVSESGGEKTQEPKPAAESHSHGGAQSLDAGTRSQMESAFGENFGDVRVHTGKGAGDASKELGARAFTRGRDIYFNEGEYNPSTREGKELLAHELTHVVQQGGDSSGARADSKDQTGDVHEQEADTAAASVLSGERAHVERRSAAPAFQRQQQRGGQTPTVVDMIAQLLLPQTPVTVNLAGTHAQVGAFMLTLPGARADTVHLTLPRGVVMEPPVDLSNMNMQAPHARVTGPAAVVIGVRNQNPGRTLFQRMFMVDFRVGNKVFIVTFILPPLPAPAPASPAPGPAPPGGMPSPFTPPPGGFRLPPGMT